MFVNLFNASYAIEITSKPLMREGKQLDAMLQQSTLRIFISAAISPAGRREALIHELRHVHIKHLGLPATEESDCRDVSKFLGAIMDQVDSQGGNVALMALKPVTQAYSANEYRGFAPNSRHDCRLCGGITMSGSVQQGEVKMHATYGQNYVERHFECECCGATNRWSEFCSESGAPTGQPVPGVEYKAA